MKPETKCDTTRNEKNTISEKRKKKEDTNYWKTLYLSY